jgi:hypothetical protein
MGTKTILLAGVCLAAAAAAPSARAQGGCSSSQSSAVQCFVHNAVKTNITQLHFGLTMDQYLAYGVAVMQILQTNPTCLMLVGTSSATADAMPPTNADGSANAAAQQSAINNLVSAEVANGLATEPSGVTLQYLQFFSQDVANAMNNSGGYTQLLTPGVGLRVIDAYVVTGTTAGVVNWTQVNANLATAVSTFISAGLIKLPPNVSAANVTAFVQSVAQTIYNYKGATGRATL